MGVEQRQGRRCGSRRPERTRADEGGRHRPAAPAATPAAHRPRLLRRPGTGLHHRRRVKSTFEQSPWYVICSRSQHGCGRTKRNLVLLEEFIIGAVEAKLAELGRMYDPEVEAEAAGAGELARLLAERDKLETKIRALHDRYETTDDLDVEDFVPMTRRLRNKLHEVEAMVAAYRQPTPADLGDDPLAAWKAGDLDERR